MDMKLMGMYRIQGITYGQVCAFVFMERNIHAHVHIYALYVYGDVALCGRHVNV